jgi:hypothetical protein
MASSSKPTALEPLSNNKRKSNAPSNAPAKKPRKDTTTESHSTAKELLKSILADENHFDSRLSVKGTHDGFVSLAKYASHLENKATEPTASNSTAAAKKSKEQIKEMVDRLRKAAIKQIEKQMTVIA